MKCQICFPNDIGVPFVIFINSGDGETQHGARIKVVKGNKWKNDEGVSISVEGEQRIVGDKNYLSANDFRKLLAWIDLNKLVIMKYWRKEISSVRKWQMLLCHMLIECLLRNRISLKLPLPTLQCLA